MTFFGRVETDASSSDFFDPAYFCRNEPELIFLNIFESTKSFNNELDANLPELIKYIVLYRTEPGVLFF